MPMLREPPYQDLGEIAFSERFFGASPDHQFSTLLHETIHIGLLTGAFRERFREGFALDDREAVRAAAGI